MKLLTPALAVLTAVVVAGILWLCGYAGMRGVSLWEFYLDSRLPTQLTDLLLSLATVALLVVGLLRGVEGAIVGAPVLKAAIWIAPVLGLVAALQADWETWRVASEVHVHNMRMLAPGLAEGMAPLAIGLLCATICAALAYGVGRQAAAR
jgi:hypothetical protein